MQDTFSMKTRRSIWIVQHDESPHNTILGVFPSSKKAAVFAEEVKEQFENGVLTGQFVIGYRFDDSSGRYTTGDKT